MDMFPKAFGKGHLFQKQYVHRYGFVVAYNVFGYYQYIGLDGRVVSKLTINEIDNELIKDYLKIRDKAVKSNKDNTILSKGDVVKPRAGASYLSSYKEGVVDHLGQFTTAVKWDNSVIIYCYNKDIEHV